MSWSLNIGKIAGTAIRIHFTFLLFLAWIFVASYLSGGAATAWDTTLFIVLVFACVVAHEFGHILTARAFGVPTPDVTLLPIGGVARLERIPEDPRQEFLIAIAGPMVNVAISLVLIGVFGAQITGNVALVENDHVSLIDRLAAVNLFLAVFNLIPAFPMDGGRVLRALLGIRMGFVHATEVAASIGQAVAFALGFIGLLYNPLLIFIAIFVYLAAASEAHMVALQAASRGVPVTAAMMTQFATLEPTEPIEQAVDTLLRTSQSEFPVVDGAGKPIGLLGRGDIIRALKELGPQARVADAMVPELPTVAHHSRLSDAFKLLQDKRAPAVAVINAQGKLVGLVTAETVGEMVMVQNARPDHGRFGPWNRPQPRPGH
jgi:Zn-dependent protease/CBS domain-containing protein